MGGGVYIGLGVAICLACLQWFFPVLPKTISGAGILGLVRE